MQIEIGKTYKTRSTDETVKISHLVEDKAHCDYGKFVGYYTNGGHAYWTEEGHWYRDDHETPWDLVAAAEAIHGL